MPEISPRPSEQFPVPETPEIDAEKGADVLPIRPDVIVPSRENAVSEEEAQKVVDEIKKINAKITRLRRDQDAMHEGLNEDAEEAGRQILSTSWLSRIGGLFSRKKEKKPLVYDEATRNELASTAGDVERQIADLKLQRLELAGRLGKEQSDELQAEWEVLNRIYEEIRKEERGE